MDPGFLVASFEYQDVGLGALRIQEERIAHALLRSEIQVSGSIYGRGKMSCLKYIPYRSAEQRRSAEVILSLAEKECTSRRAIVVRLDPRNPMRVRYCLEVTVD